VVPLTPPALDPEILRAAAIDLGPTAAVTFLVDDDAVTYAVDGATIRVDGGRTDSAVVVRLSRQAWGDLVGQIRTAINLLLSNELGFERGGFEQLADWDPILRYLHAGIPPYDPSRADFAGRDPAARSPSIPTTPNWPPSCRPWATCTSAPCSQQRRCGRPTARSTGWRPGRARATTSPGG